MTDDTPDSRRAQNRWTDLARGISAGDPGSEEELVRIFHPNVMAMTMGRMRDLETARELTQEILMGVVQALRKGLIREPEKLPAFVLGTARNLINHHLQQKALRPASVPSIRTSALYRRPTGPLRPRSSRSRRRNGEHWPAGRFKS